MVITWVVLTGKVSGLIVVDCDRRNGGMDWYEANKDNLGNCIKETTPNGGIHIYYKYPKTARLWNQQADYSKVLTSSPTAESK